MQYRESRESLIYGPKSCLSSRGCVDEEDVERKTSDNP